MSLFESLNGIFAKEIWLEKKYLTKTSLWSGDQPAEAEGLLAAPAWPVSPIDPG